MRFRATVAAVTGALALAVPAAHAADGPRAGTVAKTWGAAPARRSSLPPPRHPSSTSPSPRWWSTAGSRSSSAPPPRPPCRSGTTAYKNVKTVKSGSGGALKATVTASVDGTFRYAFAGTSTTAAAKSAG